MEANNITLDESVGKEIPKGKKLVKRREFNWFSTMRKRMLGTMGWLLVALLLLPVGAMAQPAKEKVRVTAGVFDSYDNTFVRDEYGVPQNRRTHEKGGELWVSVDGLKTFIPAASFNSEVEEGTELIFKVKLAKDEKGDRGEMAESSEWWEVLEWRVNGKVQDGKSGNELRYKVKEGTKSVHVGVRFQRKQFQVKVVYWKGSDKGIKDVNKSQVYRVGKFYEYTRSETISAKSNSGHDIVALTLNGAQMGAFKSKANLFRYDAKEGDLWIEAVFSNSVSARRYVLTTVTGNGEAERFQVNTLPLVGSDINKSRYPIAGKAIEKIRPFGIQPDDLCQMEDTFVILAKPKRGSRIAAIRVGGAVTSDTTFTILENRGRLVDGLFVKEGTQVLVLSDMSSGVRIDVKRNGVSLRHGDALLPGDRLTIDATSRDRVASMRVNRHAFAPGDEYVVPNSGDVYVELIPKEIDNINSWNYKVPMLYWQEVGQGKVIVKDKNGTRAYENGDLLLKKAWKTTAMKKANVSTDITITPVPAKGWKVVTLEVNGKVIDDLSEPYKHSVDNKDVYVRAVFVKETEKPALVVHTEGAMGYVDVIDVATGQRLEEGTILKEGQRLRI